MLKIRRSGLLLYEVDGSRNTTFRGVGSIFDSSQQVQPIPVDVIFPSSEKWEEDGESLR